MNQSSITAARCRLCLRLVDEQELIPMLQEDSPGPLHSFAEKLLSDEELSDAQSCSDCFSMWNMMQDFLNSCLRANEVLRCSKNVAVRKPWIASNDEQHMFITVCRVVKRHYNEMGKLLGTLKPTPWKRSVMEKNAQESPPSTSNFSQVSPTLPKLSLKTYRKSNEVDFDRNNPIKVSTMTEQSHCLKIKEEDPLDIDDSSAFVTEFNVGREDPAEHTITLIEPKVEQIDLIDSSSEDAMETRWVDNSDKKETAICFDEEKLKKICQICGTKAENMADHLETHIRKPKNRRKSENQEKEKNAVEPGQFKVFPPRRKRKPRVRVVTQITKRNSVLQRAQLQTGTLQCKECGIRMSNLLVAKLHARSHNSGNR
ncbi:uncharacterized protein LOC131425866 [Malaya genurostris]|uniref:uncharacterized protein LOC131425866 n=1 Tax=Malaya genurostris TaxID=325434 RepID=UPI0026F402F1|nr:uncharacterized protein LOC131425866 [Malaya genurostris]